MRKFMAVLAGGAFLFVAVNAMGEEAAKPKAEGKAAKHEVKKEAAAEALEAITLQGKVSKHTQEAKKAGEAPVVKYVLTTADGLTVDLPKVGKDSGIDFSKLVDKTVKVVGEGKRAEKQGKAVVRLKTVTSADEVKEPAK